MNRREPVNILLVDDQPAKLMSLDAIISDLGENVVKTGSADEALKFLLANECAVVLVDVCMPKMDGFELAEMIRQHPRFGRTAIIFISAVQVTDADRLRGYDLGAVDYIPVPIVPAVLRAKVAVFVELFRKTAELERLNTELKHQIDEVERSHQRLRFSDRMATIGTLAAGLGHDMGNLLMPIRMRLDVLEASLLPAAAREDLAAIREASGYLQRLAQSLRLLALDSENEPTSVTDVPEWWRETEGMMRNGVGRGVKIAVDIPQGLPAARIGKAALTQIVFNLVQNAGDALKDAPSGEIHVSCKADSERTNVSISIADNGPGMSPETSRRCLEPFYTTKTRGLSTGLGLTLVSALVKRAQGAIRIESELGRGTLIRLDLPAAEAAGRAAEEGAAASRPVASVTLTDPRLLAHVRSILTSARFDVLNGDPNGADVWITEPDQSGGVEAAVRFAASSEGRRAIVLGSPSPLIAAERVRIRCFQPDSKASALRSQLLDALSAGSAERSHP